MSIQQEEITLKQFTSGTTLMYFSTHLESIQDGTFDLVPSIIEFNNINQPIDLTTFDGVTLWKRNSDNINLQLSSITSNYITGHSYTIDEDRIFDEDRINAIRTDFSQGISTALNTGATTNTSDGPVVDPYALIPAHTDFVFASHHFIDDFFVNIKLNRTFGTLDTLNIYNNLVNSFPVQQADTGVVFGRLMARQVIKDEEGNNIRIPLRNVPIGIFNASEDFPISTSVDESGDRLYLNLKENSNPEEYFNIESFSADTNDYLRTASQFTAVPDQYKYITTTNENGEFIIYDVPVGNQIAVFEVDLFKQGLTKDEIALNFFPFPASNDNILDTIPNFSFKQFPVSVVPAWGTIQTGYTELDITVNYDLRKWATYYVPPMAYQGNLLGSVELFNFSPSLNVEIRDMSKEGFPIHNVPVVEIHNIYEKDEDHTLLWENEFAQLKKTAKFYEHGFKAFKVRANMYDPKGYRTNAEGIPRTEPTSQGVWLAGYQFKLYYNDKSSIFKTTGFQRDWGFTSPSWRGRDHFHLNRNVSSNALNFDTGEQSYPPYDKPWTHLYPNKYGIPAKPIEKNFFRNFNPPYPSTGRLSSGGFYYLEQPEYKDGDLIGAEAGAVGIEGAGGDGAQNSYTNAFWFANRFSKEVTALFMYKYEKGVAWGESYANGYNPSNASFPVQPGISSVVNGETFQRTECGYGYWLRPDGWPPVSPEPWGDTIYSQATRPGVGINSSTFGPGTLPVGTNNGNVKVQVQSLPIDVYNIEDKDIALALDDKITYAEGGLNLYRVIDPTNRIERGPTVIPTYATYNFQTIYYQRGGNSTRIKTAYKDGLGSSLNRDDKEEAFSRVGSGIHANINYDKLQINIKNNGNISTTIGGIPLDPGDDYIFTAIELGLNGGSMRLPGNSNFNFVTSKYEKANYTMKFLNIVHLKHDGTSYSNASHSAPHAYTIVNTNVIAAVSSPNYYLISRYSNVKTNYNSDTESYDTGGVFGSTSIFASTNSKWIHTVKMNGALFQTPNSINPGGRFDIRFWDDPAAAVGGGSSFNDELVSIDIEI